MLTIRKVREDELERFAGLEAEYHRMGETHSGGETMRLVAEEDGEWAALFVWGSGCYRLKPRDEYVGWTAPVRAERQKLVVCNRRFTVLAARGERPNLASRALALAARELPRLWLAEFGYRPLLAETFCDIEASAGTCYRASGWTELGLTKGFTRVNRRHCDFYVPNGRPKAVWVKPLGPGALETLRSPRLPGECLGGAGCSASGVSPLTVPQTESLYDALRGVRDHRAGNKSVRMGAALSLIVMAAMAGATSVPAVWRFGARLSQAQRKALHLPHMKERGTGRTLERLYRIPSLAWFYGFLRGLDVDDFARRLSAWLTALEGTLPRQIAADGKFVKDVAGLVSLVDAETGAPVAVAPATRKKGETGRCEMPVARTLLSGGGLDGALVSGDALHCQQETARAIIDSGGEYLLQIKDNQPGILANAEAVAAARSPEDVKKKSRRTGAGSRLA